jgi:tRNA pseudouridine32 synthase/23S rRNA pseudouridine746 synthase
MRDHLVDRLPRVPPTRIDAMLREQLIVDDRGPLAPDAPFRPATHLWFHRDLPDEAPVPFGIDVVHRDEHLVVVDKPHFLASIPRGAHILETALVRLRRDLDLPELSAAHRLDRMTAGLLMFVVRRQDRGAYQTLFRDRAVRKTYLALARHDPAVELPHTVRSRIIKERGIVRATEVPGEPNAETLVELLEHRAGLGRYRLTPRTGRTHQLRLHMAGLGLPILGDDFYPELTDRPLDDFRDPLQLLADALEFTDPITGQHRGFRSRRRLAGWPEHRDAAGPSAPGDAPTG